MNILKKVTDAFSQLDEATSIKSYSQPTGLETNKGKFFYPKLEEDTRQAWQNIVNTCIPTQVHTKILDTSRKYLDRLEFQLFTPQGLHISLSLRDDELKEGQNNKGLEIFLKEKISYKIFDVVGTRKFQEAHVVNFAEIYDMEDEETLRYFHHNMDLLLVAASNMHYSLLMDDYPKNTSSELLTFHEEDLDYIREINSTIQEKLNLKYIGLKFVYTRYSREYSMNPLAVLITWSLPESSARMQFAIYPINPEANFKVKEHENFYYNQIRQTIIRRLSFMTPDIMAFKYTTFKDLSPQEVRKQLVAFRKKAMSLPFTWQEVKQK